MSGTFREHERVEPISGSEPKKKVQYDPSIEEGGPSKVKFDEAMRTAGPSSIEHVNRPTDIAAVTPEDAVKKQSLIDLAATSKEAPKITPTPKDLEGQAASLRQQLDRPRAILLQMDSRSSLPAGTASQLSGHLEHIDRGLQDISKMTSGVETKSLAISSEKPPAERFLSFLTESDRRLNTFVDDLKGLNVGEKRLSPEMLLAVQVKLGFVQQELEFFTTTLNKALESTKTIMNVQI